MEKQSLLLHSCCAPCSSSVLERLTGEFDVTVCYYNPNIYPEAEYFRRLAEQKDFLSAYSPGREIGFIEENYDPPKFYDCIKGLEDEPEAGERCFRCYRLRLERAAKRAKEYGFDYFTSTLSVSSHKNARKLNEIGGELEGEYGVKYLQSDFKKKDGYKRSVELSRIYQLYRQEYCGCKFSAER